MGWFDDHHPMGSRADEEMEDAIEAMGFNRWYKDPQPAGGAGEPARVERPESEWDESKWRKTNLREGALKTHGETGHDGEGQGEDHVPGAADTLLRGGLLSDLATQLTDKDLLPLSYQKETNSAGYHNMKMYKKREVERLSWKKYGGPNGLKAAKEDKKNGVKPASPKKAAGGKTKSSASATGAKAAVLGNGKGKGKARSSDGPAEDEE
ncbi:hypothetical protein B0H17DRAFT_1272049 [Mycena rosella]|uniref:Uncharacterized protein n=1 Tax=Mycena rosella TaxID=1033263 RepID=A0AAD7DMR4_MYCRO|nr:hypothetical protein B0H17DRAFT_1272049 [Mycena rosella]